MAEFKDAGAAHNVGEHMLSLVARGHAEITGVTEVNSFDEVCVVLSTVCGELTVEGEDLRVGALDMSRGVLVVDGKVCALYYADTARSRRKGLFGGLRQS